MDVFLIALFTQTNEVLASGIVIVAASILLYNLTRNLDNRVARTSSVVLACVTVTYICDVFIALGPGLGAYISTLRLQWVGIAFMPAALFHLSDALLATTGLPSRGRRRRLIRALYGFSAGFLVLAAFSNTLVNPVVLPPNLIDGRMAAGLRGSTLFPVFVFYTVFISSFALYNVNRARLRCLTRSTRRRMGYLQIAFLTPVIGIFPFSTLLGAGEEFSLLGLAVVNLTNIIVILMLLFLAYPLSFFGSRIPDRAVKIELLRFILRGPATGILALVTIVFTSNAARILSLPGEDFTPFAVVAVVLLWQWSVHLMLPRLEQWLVYNGEEYPQIARLQMLTERLLTRSDLQQLLDVTLGAVCDDLRVNTAFVTTFQNEEGRAEVIAAVGPARPDTQLFIDEADLLASNWPAQPTESGWRVSSWHGYWIVPLYTARHQTDSNRLLGIMGIQARAAEIDLSPDEQERLQRFAARAAQTLDDILLQAEIYAALEGLLPQFSVTRSVAAEIEFKPGHAAPPPQVTSDNGLLIDKVQFKEQVKAALKHYWGGSGLTGSRLLELRLVRDAMAANENNAARALRAVLKSAIEQQKPSDGERKVYSSEWTIYNILEMRFIEREKVRDVALKLALSEPTFFRRQDEAINAVAETLLEMERSASQTASTRTPLTPVP
ncbi:MAG: hypothetical protein SF162_05645 [bacterium]|nr:hypothetical protein [bacterium]